MTDQEIEVMLREHYEQQGRTHTYVVGFNPVLHFIDDSGYNHVHMTREQFDKIKEMTNLDDVLAELAR